MKKNLFFIGMIFLGVSLIISSLIISMSIKVQPQINGTLNGTFNGTLNVTDSSIPEPYTGDILMPHEVDSLLGYSDWALLIQDIENGKLEGLPYTIIEGNYIFSKKALEEWIYNRIVN